MEQSTTLETNRFSVKTFPAFYGTPRFIATFTRARLLSIFWAWSIHSTPRLRFLKISFNIIVPYTPGSSKGSLFFKFLHQYHRHHHHHRAYYLYCRNSAQMKHSLVMRNVRWALNVPVWELELLVCVCVCVSDGIDWGERWLCAGQTGVHPCRPLPSLPLVSKVTGT